MTAAANTVGRQFSFGLGKEPSKLPYGTFYYHGDEVATPEMYFSSKEALSTLDMFVETGQIPQEEKEEIANEIKGCNLPEEKPYLGPYTYKVNTDGPSAAGYFLGAHDMVIGDTTFSKKHAREVLNEMIRLGSILESERKTILAEIEASIMPEANADALKDLLSQVLGITIPDPGPRYEGPFTLRFHPDGEPATSVSIVDKNGTEKTQFTTKQEAVYMIGRALKKGVVREGDRDALLKEIQASTLPDKWDKTFGFEVCTTCPVPVLHGYLMLDGERVGEPIMSVNSAEVTLAKVIEMGIIDEARAEEIRAEMRKAGFPESVGM